MYNNQLHQDSMFILKENIDKEFDDAETDIRNVENTISNRRRIFSIGIHDEPLYED